MGNRTFVDTKVLLYAFDSGEPGKRAEALRVLHGLETEDLVLSTQVLQEFYWNATRKLDPPLRPEDAVRRMMDLAAHRTVVVDIPLILAAASRGTLDRIAFRDALVVESALSAGCDSLLTEDLQGGRAFGTLRVENPFRV